MITKKFCTIDIACEDCERIIPQGEPCLEVDEYRKICIECGMKTRNNWLAFFESMDWPPGLHEAERIAAANKETI